MVTAEADVGKLQSIKAVFGSAYRELAGTAIERPDTVTADGL